MTNQQILEKAIQKAMANGWDEVDREFIVATDQNGFPYLLNDSGDYPKTVNYHALIFNHDFAKALWPGNILLDEGGVKIVTKEPLWRHHLMMMVVDPDPLVYLSQHI